MKLLILYYTVLNNGYIELFDVPKSLDEFVKIVKQIKRHQGFKYIGEISFHRGLKLIYRLKKNDLEYLSHNAIWNKDYRNMDTIKNFELIQG